MAQFGLVLVGQFPPHRFRQRLQIATGDLVLVVPVQPTNSPAALAAMLQAAQVNAQLLQFQGSHLLGPRLEDGRLATLEAVFPTPEARIRQREGRAETWVRPAQWVVTCFSSSPGVYSF
jgi:hypothetical protein